MSSERLYLRGGLVDIKFTGGHRSLLTRAPKPFIATANACVACASMADAMPGSADA
jgi:hypothetical protein